MSLTLGPNVTFTPRRKPAASVRMVATVPALKVKPPCVHEGPIVSWCPHGNASLDYHQCFHDDGPDTCRRSVECAACGLYTAPPPPPDTWTRHLLYHVYPVSGNGRWQWNIAELKKRLALFNGRRVCAIVREVGKPYTCHGTPPSGGRMPATTDDPEAVQAALADCGFEFIVADNDPNLREAATHGDLFGRVEQYAGPRDVTLYAHAKGTTHHPGHLAETWTAIEYMAMLDYWPVVSELLDTFPLAGCFKKYGPGWRPEQSRSDWHYSGSWFWFRNADLFARDWRRIDQFWSGIEPYPSQHFHHNEAGVIFCEGPSSTMRMYKRQFIQGTVLPEWQRWTSANAARRTAIGSSVT